MAVSQNDNNLRRNLENTQMYLDFKILKKELMNCKKDIKKMKKKIKKIKRKVYESKKQK